MRGEAPPLKKERVIFLRSFTNDLGEPYGHSKSKAPSFSSADNFVGLWRDQAHLGLALGTRLSQHKNTAKNS